MPQQRIRGASCEQAQMRSSLWGSGFSPCLMTQPPGDQTLAARQGKTLSAAGRPGSSWFGAPGALPFLPALGPNECGHGRCGKFCPPYINATSYKTATENRFSFLIEGNKKIS